MPKPLYSKLHVILDPGHGGEDTGSIHEYNNSKISEKELTLLISKQILKNLKKRNVYTQLTRSADTVVPLDTRTGIAKKYSYHKNLTTVFVSIHINSSFDPSINGIETYIFNATSNEASQRLADIENGSHRVQQKGTLNLILSDLTATANVKDSVELACQINEDLFNTMKKKYPIKAHSIKNRGVKKGLFYVLMDARVPSVLIELGFGSNAHDLSTLMNPTYQDVLAKGIADGIINWALINQKRNSILATNPSAQMISGVSKSNLNKCKYEP